jgi:hypothetical protein
MRRGVLLLSLVVSGCGDSRAPVGPSAPTLAPAPTSWAIRGQVLAAPAGAPIEGASLKFGDAGPISTGVGGIFTI